MSNTSLAVSAVAGILTTTKDMQIMKPEDVKFLQEHKEHFGAVLENTYIWRTDIQKLSILNNVDFPTTHAKFHQAMLEQKVQFEQTMYLAKDFEMQKLEMEELEAELAEVERTMAKAEEANDEYTNKMSKIKAKKLSINIQFKQFELKQQQIAMKYRMSEVKGWQKIQEGLMQDMLNAGISMEDIWNKEAGDFSAMFFSGLNRYEALAQATDTAEQNNLIALAVFVIQQAQANGVFEKLKKMCTEKQLRCIERVIANHMVR